MTATRRAATLSRIARPTAWPAPVLNGISVGLGVAVLTALIGGVAGLPAAITAASGAATTSVADTVCAPQAKASQMWPAVLTTLGVTVLVACVHGQPLALTATILLTVFVSIFWMAWGKRGGPQTFVMVLTLVFQMAAFGHQAMPGWQAVQHVAWVALGSLGMAACANLSIRCLAQRYRTLALADSLDALAATMQAQARWTESPVNGPTGPAPSSSALLALIGQQAALSDTFQHARDLLYSQAGRADLAPVAVAQIQALMHAVNLRDVVQACQLDLDRLPALAHTQAQAQTHAPAVLQALSGALRREASRLSDTAWAWRHGKLPPPSGEASHGAQPTTAWPDTLHTDAVGTSLARRCRHIADLVAQIASSLPARQRTEPATLPPEQAAVMQTLVSPTRWTWPPLKAQLHTASPVLRYAVRATLAIGCAHGLAHVLPWTSHPHWLLMTVAVVMRGNLEQTLARRDARVQGTLVGCLIASGLLNLWPHSAWLMLPLVMALSLAHGFVLINYRVTAAAGAVLALIQGHLFSPGEAPALIDAAERLGDTVIGATLAWAFSYVWPAWEAQQLPRMATRLLRAQAHYARHALHWHEVHAGSAQRSHARREVYDVVWLLMQSLQRMGKEPRHLQDWAPSLERVLIHSHRVTSHLAAVKGLLTVHPDVWQDEAARRALADTEAQLLALLQGQGSAPVPKASHREDADDLDPTLGEHAPAALSDRAAVSAWLQRRLSHLRHEARLLAQSAQALQQASVG